MTRLRRIIWLVIFQSALWQQAWANDAGPPYAWINSLSQEGQDVSIVLSTVASREFTLKRSTELDSKTVFKDKSFFVVDADSQGLVCDPTFAEVDLEYCQEHSDECYDCDQDGVPECDGECSIAYYFEVFDNCVPPSNATYSLWAGEEGLDAAEILVEDLGEECSQESAGCSVSNLGGTAEKAWLLAFLMILVGIGFYGLDKRSSQTVFRRR